jgi:hypothetical protein
VLLIPEDRALGDIAIGFRSRVAHLRVEPPVGGKARLREQLVTQEIEKLRRFPNRFLVLVRDFDGQRLTDLRDAIPDDLQHRVFILGPLNEAEDLRAELLSSNRLDPNTWERIGQLLADECLSGARTVQQLGQLAHLDHEFDRARSTLMSLLAPT